MLKVLSMIVAMFLFISTGSVAKYIPENEEKLLLSAAVISDVHMESNNPDRFIRFGKVLTGVTKTSRPFDIVAFTGDNTMNGQGIEWFDFYGFVNRFIKKSEVLVAMGNHDFGNTSDQEVYKELSAECLKTYNYYLCKNMDKLYYCYEQNGFRFIVLCSENNAEDTVSVISDTQIEWLKAELAKSANDGKPAVVLNHNLIAGKNGERSEYDFNLTDNNDKLCEALENADTKVIYISGHSHFGMSESSVNTEGNVTYINLPSAGNEGNYEADDEGSASGIGCTLEYYKNKVVIRFRNFANGTDLEKYRTVIDY